MGRGMRLSRCWALCWVFVTAALFGCDGASKGAEPAEPTASAGEAGPVAPDANDPRKTADEPGDPLADFQAPPPPPMPELPPPPGADEVGECPSSRDRSVGLMFSPKRPAKGKPVRVMAATLADPHALALEILDPDGEPVVFEGRYERGAPASTIARFTPEKSGTYNIRVGRDGTGLRCLKMGVQKYKQPARVPDANLDNVWKVKRAWTGAEEALFSAFVRELFKAEVGEDLAYKSLDQVTRDKARNILWGHLGWGEDRAESALKLIPDCADTPYFLRAYYAWKRGLAFGFRRCSRGKSSAPSCYDVRTQQNPPELKETWRVVPEGGELEPPIDEETGEALPKAEPFNALMVIDRFFRRTLAWGVHTGNGRCAHGDSATDFYPVTLNARGLRPGVIYADPYGHILVVVELVPQRGKHPGILYAVDGQPDGSITRKRFWEGNFLWNPDPALGGSGFKAFRPLAYVEAADGSSLYVQLDDAAIADRSDYADLGDGEPKLDGDAFYDRMERIISPGERDPFLAQEAAVRALAEAARVRVTSVQNGEDYVAKLARENQRRVEKGKAEKDQTIEMPDGYAVFETSGAWESFATPARDLRLLLAIDVVEGFADKVRRQPDGYGLTEADLDGPAGMIAKLDKVRTSLLERPEFAITYVRSDGSDQSITLAQLLDRKRALEMAYNPNDCVEIRWGAEGDEASTCTRHRDQWQSCKMEHYRDWFENRRRPSRNETEPVQACLPPEPEDG